jgi:hypothetical protein
MIPLRPQFQMLFSFAGRVEVRLIENQLRLETSPFRGTIKHRRGVRSSVCCRPVTGVD